MWIDYLSVLIVPLAVWRVSNMLADVEQGGPFDILTKLRMLTGMYYNDRSEPQFKDGSLAQLLSCVYCNSVWIGLLFTMALVCSIRATTIVSLPFALSGVAIIIEKQLLGN